MDVQACPYRCVLMRSECDTCKTFHHLSGAQLADAMCSAAGRISPFHSAIGRIPFLSGAELHTRMFGFGQVQGSAADKLVYCNILHERCRVCVG